jgi:hypothetical protein
LETEYQIVLTLLFKNEQDGTYSAFRYVSLLKTENAEQRGSDSDKGTEVSRVLEALHDFPSRKNFSNTEDL